MKISPTRRYSHVEPNIQNIPGSWADAIDKALERGDKGLAADIVTLCHKITGTSRNND